MKTIYSLLLSPLLLFISPFLRTASANPFLMPLMKNAPQVLQQKDTGTAATGSSRTITINASGAGHLIAVAVAMASPTVSVSSITDNAGNAYVSASARGTDSAGASTEIWYAKNSKAGATSVTVHFTGSIFNMFWVAEVSRIDLTSPVDTKGSISNGNANPSTSASLTTTQSHDFVYAVIFQGGVVSGATTPFTEQSIVNGNAAAYLKTVKTGTYHASWNVTANNYCSSVVAFKSQL